MANSDSNAQLSGSLLIIDTLPPWKRSEFRGERPSTIPLWTGQADPPAIGAKVHVRLNNLGSGTVTAYAVHEGYLGVMVRIDESNRPDWHRQSNPENLPGLLYGVEINTAPPAG